MSNKLSDMPDVKVIALDWDGTIVDSVPYKLAQNQSIAQAFGQDLSIDEVRRIWNESAGFDALMRNLTQSDDKDAITRVLESGYDDPRYAKRTFDFAKPALRNFRKQGYKLAVVTNATQQIIGMDAARLDFDMEADFDCLITTDISEYKKPDARVFDRLLGQFGISANELVYIGDEMKDFYTARNAGTHFIGVTTGMSTAEEFDAEGVMYVADLGEIANTSLHPGVVGRATIESRILLQVKDE